MKSKRLNERLKYALDNQIGWQKYAEAKNLILFTGSGMTILAAFEQLNLGNSSTIHDIPCHYYILIGTSFISLIVSIFSFILVSSPSKSLKDKGLIIDWTFNYKMKFDRLLEIAKKYSEEKYTEDLVEQHRLGSKHTRQKYFLFNMGVLIYSLGLVTFIIMLFYNVIKN